MFIQLHAEQAYTNIELYKKNSLKFSNALSVFDKTEQTNEDNEERKIKNIEYGVFGKRLTNTTLVKLQKFVSEQTSDLKFLVIDFNNLAFVQKNIFQLFHKIVEYSTGNTKALILLNISDYVFELLKLDSLKVPNRLNLKNDSYLFSNDIDITEKEVEDLSDSLIEQLFEETLLRETGLNLNEGEPELNPSSSVYINKYVNIKNLLNDDKFFAYCIYKMALLMTHSNGRDWVVMPDYESELEKISLFFQTLNGAYIASSLSDLLHSDICYVDHIGPINKLYNTYFGEKIKFGKKYIVISDVICLGTEVKIAKSLIEHSGGVYLGNSSIIRSNTLKERKFSDIVYLFEINKETNKKYNLNYKIIAELS